MALLSPQDRQTLTAHLAPISRKVDLLLFTQTIGGWERESISTPALVVLGDGADTRIRFYGANTGYEFVSLVEAVLLAGTGDLELEPETVASLAAVDKPMHIQVFSTPT